MKAKVLLMIKNFRHLQPCHMDRFSGPVAHHLSSGGTTRRFFLNATGGRGRSGVGPSRSDARSGRCAGLVRSLGGLGAGLGSP